MKKIFLFLVILFSFSRGICAEVDSSLWQTEKSQHFIIYYQDDGAGFVKELINQAENYYNSIVDELGFRRFDFWSWDRRAKIYLYKSSSEYHRDTRRMGWSGAMVSVKQRTIKTYIGQGNFFDSMLPHEMTHIIFREFVGDRNHLPLWLDEGIASSQEKANLANRMGIAKDIINQDAYLKFDDLSEIRDSSLIVPHTFYAESASIIVFLMEEYGSGKFLDFCRKLRDAEPWKQALLRAYHFSNFEEMERAWKSYILKRS
ncbi:MAG: peptidase MA family metallohydrolase [Candidatus Omnitrophota bacterium]